MGEADTGYSLFDAATDYVATLAQGNTLTDADKLQLYALYKQATCGPCTLGRPNIFDFKGRAKWAAWSSLGSKKTEDAKQDYVELLTQKAPDWCESNSESGSSQRSGLQLGPVFSSLAHAPEDTQGQPQNSLHERACQADVCGVRQLLQAGVPVNERDAEGCSALHWAADRGCIEVMEELLQHGADVDARDSDGATPLHYAVLCEQKQACIWLLRAGADVSVRKADGETPRDICPTDWDKWLGSANKSPDD